MNKVTQIVLAVGSFIIVGFLIVGTSEKSDEEKKNDAFVAGYGAMSTMASNKCPKAVKKHTGNSVYFPTSTDSDKQSYITLTYEGRKEDSYKTAVCKFERAKGGIGELTIDGKVVQSK